MIIHEVDQRTPEWYALRAGIPTASEFSKLITPTGKLSKSSEAYALMLAAELFAGGPLGTWGGNMDLDRGRFLEEEALRWYEFERNVTIQKVGFVTDDGQTIGCSPDGLVGDDGMVEVKCMNAQNHISAMIDWLERGESPTEYLAQTQGQLWITGRKWCDLILYHANLPPLVIRQTPNMEVRATLETAIAGLIKRRDEVLSLLKRAEKSPAPPKQSERWRFR